MPLTDALFRINMNEKARNVYYWGRERAKLQVFIYLPMYGVVITGFLLVTFLTRLTFGQDRLRSKELFNSSLFRLKSMDDTACTAVNKIYSRQKRTISFMLF